MNAFCQERNKNDGTGSSFPNQLDREISEDK